MTEPKKYTLAGVMGWPVDHSRSPLVHNHWITQYGLRGAYVLLPVQPDSLRDALRALPLLGFAGCNLTIPHKVSALSMVDHIEPLARKIGAVNTIVVGADGSLTGRNTDGYGFLQSLLDAQPHWSAQAGTVAVVGAGGAARAILVSLIDSGCKDIRLTNRSWAKAQDMAQEFGAPVHAVTWESRHECLEGITLLVNTTNQGMHGQPALDLALHRLPPQALVADAIYVPLETPLLAAARKNGNRTVNGLGMLLHQARPAFQAWFGVSPKLTPELLVKVNATF
jgi:shikimate dehydrogenase